MRKSNKIIEDIIKVGVSVGIGVVVGISKGKKIGETNLLNDSARIGRALGSFKKKVK